MCSMLITDCGARLRDAYSRAMIIVSRSVVVAIRRVHIRRPCTGLSTVVVDRDPRSGHIQRRHSLTYLLQAD